MAKSQKHPKGLMVLFFTEMWERFSYYGMRALLVLYLTSELIHGGFGLDRAKALEIYAIFTGLVYLTPLLGGFLADKFFGQRKSIYIGGILMALGQFALATSQAGAVESRNLWLSIGLGILAMGNGFFKPNISSIVGKLYSEDDPRKDSAFTIFYMGINIGAFAAPIIAGTLGEKIGWMWGFSSAGIGMLIGTAWFYFQRKALGPVGMPPTSKYAKNGRTQLDGREFLEIVLYVIAISLAIFGAIKLWAFLSEDFKNTLITVAAIAGASALLYVIIRNTSGKKQWSRVAVILVLCFFNIFFWAGFEQAGGTFNLFAAENTDRMILNWEIPASLFQSVNPIFIIILAPVFSWLWLRLSSINKEPRTPVKFGFALVFLGLGFVVMSWAWNLSSGSNLVSPLWLVVVYFVHTSAELCLSPIGLSMISKLSPPSIVSVMMGFWFATIASAQYLAGVLEAILIKYMPDMPLFVFLSITSIGGGLVLLAISPILNRMMKGIH